MLSRARERQLGSGGRPLLTDGGAKAIGFRRASAGVGNRFSRLLNQLLLFNETPEIRLVHVEACDRLDASLQLQKREYGRHQFEDHWVVFDLGPHPRNTGRKDAAMIARHGMAQRRVGTFGVCVARLGDQSSLVQELIALEDQFLVPLSPFESEVDRRPFLTRGFVASTLRPAAELARN